MHAGNVWGARTKLTSIRLTHFPTFPLTPWRRMKHERRLVSVLWHATTTAVPKGAKKTAALRLSRRLPPRPRDGGSTELLKDSCGLGLSDPRS